MDRRNLEEFPRCQKRLLGVRVSPQPEELAQQLRAGDRRALAQAITLVESTRTDHRVLANELLDILCSSRTGQPEQDAQPNQNGKTKRNGGPTRASRPVAKRIGISGTPGVGKSTLIESLGLHLIEQGSRVAVLAIDPSSVRTGGSIMGDKTRMSELSRSPAAFIRPSASQGVLGGIANRTGEVISLVEAAGYDTIIVETVGVGQSEVAVASVTDLFVLLVAPAGGDDLQGIKRGVMELVDAVLVNKADGDLVNLATHTASDYRHALSFLRPKNEGHTPPVMTCSALSNTGIAEAWNSINELWLALTDGGLIAHLRSIQAQQAFDREIEAILVHRLLETETVSGSYSDLHAQVSSGALAPSSAAATLAALLIAEN